MTAFMMSMNRKYFYRRWLSRVIPAGLLMSAIGFSFGAFVSTDSAIGHFRWNGAASGVFFLSWAFVVACLVVGDMKQQKELRQ